MICHRTHLVCSFSQFAHIIRSPRHHLSFLKAHKSEQKVINKDKYRCRLVIQVFDPNKPNPWFLLPVSTESGALTDWLTHWPGRTQRDFPVSLRAHVEGGAWGRCPVTSRYVLSELKLSRGEVTLGCLLLENMFIKVRLNLAHVLWCRRAMLQLAGGGR